VTDGIHSIPSHIVPQPQSRSDDADHARHARRDDAPRDTVELSDAAHKAQDEAPIRKELVERIRAQIADGSYLTDDKVNQAAEGLLRDALRRL